MVGARPDPFHDLAVACRRCGAPTSVWCKVDDTDPILVCVTHGGMRDCPGKQPLPPAVAAVWTRLHPDAGPVERARLEALLARYGYPASRRPPPAAAEPDDDDAPRQLTLF